MKATYKEFGEYLQTVGELYTSCGDKELEKGNEFYVLFDKLCKMAPDDERGAERILELKDAFCTSSEKYGCGWIDQNAYKDDFEAMFEYIINDKLLESKRMFRIEDFLKKHVEDDERKRKEMLQSIVDKVKACEVWMGKRTVDLIVTDIMNHFSHELSFRKS